MIRLIRTLLEAYEARINARANRYWQRRRWSCGRR